MSVLVEAVLQEEGYDVPGTHAVMEVVVALLRAMSLVRLHKDSSLQEQARTIPDHLWNGVVAAV
jgi:hypothetical protein